MKTDELVAALANSAGPVEDNAARRRFSMALGWGVFGTTLAMALSLGVRPDILDVSTNPMFWIKLLFPASVAVTMFYAATRLASPGVRLGRIPGALVALIGVIWTLALVVLLSAAPEERKALVFGDTWIFCLIGIPLLSIPVFIAAMWAMKGLAPIRPALAGAAAGLLAGAVSASVYALHCPELEAPFIAIWYVIGMFIPAIAGAWVGQYLLRW